MYNTVVEKRVNPVDVDINNERFTFNPVNRFDREMIQNYINANPEFFYYKLIDDNYRFENLAYREYRDSSLWDMLMILNINEEMMYSLPVDYDTILANAEITNNEMKPLFQNFDEERNLARLKEDYNKENERKREIRFIKKEYVPTFLEYMKECVYEF